MRLILVLLLLFGATVSAAADQSAFRRSYSVAPPPMGSDSNDCISAACATIQHAADLCPAAWYCAINIAPGVYSQKTNVYYYKVIAITGPTDAKGQCVNRHEVTVDDLANGVRRTGSIFSVQDHAILTVRCMTLRANGTGTTGFAARQFAIGDVNDIDFLQFPSGTAVAATETSKVNVFNPSIAGNSSRFAFATDLSQITIDGLLRLARGLRFDVAFVTSVHKSIVSLYPSAIEGGEGMSGASYQCADSTINRSVTLPGGDVPYVGNFDCALSGLASDHDPLTAMGLQFDNQLAAARAEFGEQLSTTRAEFIAIAAALALLLAVSFCIMLALHWQNRRLIAGQKLFGGK